MPKYSRLAQVKQMYYSAYMNVTFSHLRSMEFISVHMSCTTHSRDATKCSYTGVHSDAVWESGAFQTSTLL